MMIKVEARIVSITSWLCNLGRTDFKMTLFRCCLRSHRLSAGNKRCTHKTCAAKLHMHSVHPSIPSRTSKERISAILEGASRVGMTSIHWGIILKPQPQPQPPPPHKQGKTMNKHLAAKLSSLPCFEAFGGHAFFRFVFICWPCMWGADVTCAVLIHVVDPPPASWCVSYVDCLLALLYYTPAKIRPGLHCRQALLDAFSIISSSKIIISPSMMLMETNSETAFLWEKASLPQMNISRWRCYSMFKLNQAYHPNMFIANSL